MQYPFLEKYNLPVERREGMAYVPSKELDDVLVARGIKEQFIKLFGVQTQMMGGPFAWDVECVLERIERGSLSHPVLFD